MVSALSLGVKQLICADGVNDVFDDKILLSISTDMAQELKLLNLDYLTSKLPEYEETPMYFKLATRSLASCFFTCDEHLKKINSRSFQSHYSHLLQWTGQSEIFEDCVRRGGDDFNTLLSLLVATATLERALGDLHLIHADDCPSMLKDLLLSQELETILGKTVISLLRILIGPPISLNIRNVVWHGFPQPGEIPRRYLSFILLLVPTIGHSLKSKNIVNINHRNHVGFVSISHFTDFPAPHIELLGKCHQKSAIITDGFLSPSMSDVLKFAIVLYEQGQYGYCTCLLLPQLEHALRRMFAKVNNCPERVLTAESTALYTTFDEMLQSSLPIGQINNLIDKLSESKMDLLFDLLVYPEGPRVRDRLSHGEAAIISFPDRLASAVIGLFTSLIVTFTDFEVSELGKEELAFFNFYKDYESRFHPISLMKIQLKSLSELMDKVYPILMVNPELENLTLTQEEWLSSSENLKEYCTKVSTVIDDIDILWKDSTYKKEHLDRYKPLFSDSHHFIECIVSKKISTSFRGHAVFNKESSDLSSSRCSLREAEIVTLLQKIGLETEITVKQTLDAITVRQQQLLNRELRSRQRENMKKLIESIPFLNTTARLLLFLVSWLLYSLEDFIDQNASCQLVRFLKSVLQYTENMRTYSNKEKNKWLELQELCVKCVDKITLFIHNK